MAKYKTYLINLEDRPDRLANVLRQFDNSDIDIIRVPAVPGEELKKYHIATPMPLNNVACWHSHMKVLDLFLKTEDDFCVVLEDDVLFTEYGVDFLSMILNCKINGIDILQFGYVPVNGKVGLGKSDRVFRHKARLRRALIKSLLYFIDTFVASERIHSRVNRTRRLLNVFQLNEAELKLKFPLVEGFEPGTHCYLINREAAETLRNYNSPALMGADLSLFFLAMAKHLMIVRTSSTFAIQDDSPVSTGLHTKFPYDIGSLIMDSN